MITILASTRKVVLFVFLFLFSFGYVFATTFRGPNDPLVGSMSNDNSNGAYDAWSNPSNVISSNNVRATVLLDGTFSQYLKVTGWGFNVPTGATIEGIVMETEVSDAGDGPGFIVDRAARIIKGGTIGSADRKNTTHWTTTDTYLSHGGATDLWGETWTSTYVNHTKFGFALSADHSDASLTARIDHIRMTVYYSGGTPLPPPPLVATLSASNIGVTSALLNATADPQGEDAGGWFRISSTNPGNCNDAFGSRIPSNALNVGYIDLGNQNYIPPSSISFSATSTSLSASTSYYFCALAASVGGLATGTISSFTTNSQ